jgi:hypothetical protein
MFEPFCTLMKSLTAVLDWGLGLICSLNSRTYLADTSWFIAMLDSTGALHTAYGPFTKDHVQFLRKEGKTSPFLLIQPAGDLFLLPRLSQLSTNAD